MVIPLRPNFAQDIAKKDFDFVLFESKYETHTVREKTRTKQNYNE